MQAMKGHHLAVHLSIETARWQFNLDEVWQIAFRRQRPLRANVWFLMASATSGHRLNIVVGAGAPPDYSINGLENIDNHSKKFGVHQFPTVVALVRSAALAPAWPCRRKLQRLGRRSA